MLSLYIRVGMQEPCNSEARAMLLDMWDPKVSRVCRAPVVTVAAAASNYCILVCSIQLTYILVVYASSPQPPLTIHHPLALEIITRHDQILTYMIES